MIKKIVFNVNKTCRLVLLTFVWSTSVSAHETEGSLKATAGASATDLYSISCFKDAESSSEPTQQLFVNVRNNVKGAGVMNVIAYKSTATGGITKTATDLVGGDYKASPDIMLSGGEGDYQVFVNHTENTAQSYMLQYHCQDAAKQHTGTQLNLIQDE